MLYFEVLFNDYYDIYRPLLLIDIRKGVFTIDLLEELDYIYTHRNYSSRISEILQTSSGSLMVWRLEKGVTQYIEKTALDLETLWLRCE